VVRPGSKPERALGRARRRIRDALVAPPDVEAVLAAAPGERLLSWARERDGTPLVATTHGLRAYGDRLAWIEIDRVRWADGVLAVLAVDGETRELTLPEPRDLPAIVKAEVEASVVVSKAVALRPDGRGATVAARRGATGVLHWRVRYDSGIAPDEATQATVDRVIADLRVELGI